MIIEGTTLQFNRVTQDSGIFISQGNFPDISPGEVIGTVDQESVQVRIRVQVVVEEAAHVIDVFVHESVEVVIEGACGGQVEIRIVAGEPRIFIYVVNGHFVDKECRNVESRVTSSGRDDESGSVRVLVKVSGERGFGRRHGLLRLKSLNKSFNWHLNQLNLIEH